MMLMNLKESQVFLFLSTNSFNLFLTVSGISLLVKVALQSREADL